jgi:predicted porin
MNSSLFSSFFASLFFARPAVVVAIAACGLASAGGALAQSNVVSMFGTVDLNVTYSKAGGQSNTAMDQGGNIFPSRLGFRGIEDLGGGLNAGFWLEAALLPDTGEQQGVMFHRRSTVSLSDRKWGEVRLGRDYTPTFWNVSQFSPFGTVGVAGSANLVEGWPFGLGGARSLARANNSVGYFLPRDFGGFYGQAMYAFPEGQDGMRYTGARLGYAKGPLDIATAVGRTPLPAEAAELKRTYRSVTWGGTYDFSVAKLFANYHRHWAEQDKQAHTMLGVTVPVGVGVIKASVVRANRSGPGVDGDDATQWSAGYVHWLSKRTALYGTYSSIRNQGNAAYVTTDSSPVGVPGTTSSGLQVGVSHNF